MAELENSSFDVIAERDLRARILQLEAFVEARTQAIVGLGAQLAELRGDGSPVMAERLREAERQLAELHGHEGHAIHREGPPGVFDAARYAWLTTTRDRTRSLPDCMPSCSSPGSKRNV